MAISYTDSLSDLNPAQLSGFFAGWPKHPDPDAHLAILRGSHAAWLAMDGDRCVGFVNALSDGGFYAHIPLLEVLPEYQGRGIGSELLRRMAQTLEGHYAVDVLCDEEVAAFYESRGFRRCVGMASRNYQHQGRFLPASAAQPDPGPLTANVLELMNRSVLCWLATVDDQGGASVSPKEVFARRATPSC